MKIGLVVTGGFDRSGRERVVPSLLWLVERLARRHEVHVFVLRYYPEPCTYPLLGATVHDVGRVDGPAGTRRFRLRRRLAAAVAHAGPFDVLHAYWGLPAGFLATRIAAATGVPVIVTFDSGELVAIDDIGYGLQRRWIDRRAIASIVRAATAVTVTTDFMATMPALGSAKPLVIPIGVDPATFPYARRVDGPPWRLLRVASINAVKDYPTLLHTLARLMSHVPDVHLDIVGEDTLNGSAQRLASRLGLDRHVTFHGFQPTDRLADFYARAHLNLVTSRHEAAGVVVLEAACTGLPTVGTAVGYVADWHPERAIAVPIGNPDALATAIAGLLHDRDRRTRIADAARAWSLAHDADWTTAQFDALYQHCAR